MRRAIYLFILLLGAWPLNAQTSISGVKVSGVHIGFSPFAIAGLAAWYDSDQGITLDTTGGVETVSQWNDMSTLGRHATQATKANQPTYVRNVLNGKPVVRFTGTPVFMSANSLASIATGNDIPFSAFTVTLTAVQGTGYQWAFGNNASNTPLVRLSGINAAGNTIYTRIDDAAATDNLTAGGGTGMSNTWYIISMLFGGSSTTIHRNNTTGTGNVNVGVITLDTFAIGAWNRNGGVTGNYLTGDFTEIIFYNRNLNDSERLRVQTYLNEKYKVF